MSEQQHRIIYTGSAPFASAVAQTLTEEGLDLSWTRPDEQRGMGTMVEAVTVYYFCKATDATVKAAVDKARERLGRRGRLDLDGDDGDDSGHGRRHVPKHRG
jgi:hypothetical protein